MQKAKIKLGLLSIVFSMLFCACEDVLIKPASSNLNLEDFEVAWARVDDVYPFLEFKNVNWDSIYEIYRPRAEAAQGDEFYFVLHDLLAELKDGHTYYRTNGGGQIYPFYPQRHFKDRHAYSPFVVRQYFDKPLRLTQSKSMEYEILPNNIGYIFISDFQENYLVDEFPGVLDYVKNTTGLIIDIRQKRGGSFQNVEAVVSSFITEALAVPNFYMLGEAIELQPFQPAQGFVYTNSVVVIINGSTFSAGELCTEILKQLPQITAIGDTTGGGGVASNSQPQNARGVYVLPSGKTIYIGTGYFERYDGQTFEWQGVIPDIRIVQTANDIEAGRDKQLEFAIDFLQGEN
jgi:hypothetical protein